MIVGQPHHRETGFFQMCAIAWRHAKGVASPYRFAFTFSRASAFCERPFQIAKDDVSAFKDRSNFAQNVSAVIGREKTAGFVRECGAQHHVAHGSNYQFAIIERRKLRFRPGARGDRRRSGCW